MLYFYRTVVGGVSHIGNHTNSVPSAQPKDPSITIYTSIFPYLPSFDPRAHLFMAAFVGCCPPSPSPVSKRKTTRKTSVVGVSGGFTGRRLWAVAGRPRRVGRLGWKVHLPGGARLQHLGPPDGAAKLLGRMDGDGW